MNEAHAQGRLLSLVTAQAVRHEHAGPREDLRNTRNDLQRWVDRARRDAGREPLDRKEAP